MVNAYDEIAYPSYAHSNTHPDKLATHAIMFGLPHAPADRCRFLEFGSGDGTNILPMAVAYPDSHFVGVDYAAEPVARGQALIKDLGLTNIELIHADILDVDLGEEPFDYIAAHGVYAWVPPTVRDAMMRLIGRFLAPQGVAYVSYDALPGGYVRLLIRNEVLFATRKIQGREARIQAVLPLLRQFADRPEDQCAFGKLVGLTAGNMLNGPASVLAHDALNDDYNPAFLYEFSDHCARYGLQILTDAVPNQCPTWFAEGNVSEDQEEIIEKAQKADFEKVQFFHQSIVVRDDVKIDRRPSDERLLSLYVSSPVGGKVIESGGIMSLPTGTLGATTDKLAAIWPAAARVGDVIQSPNDLAGLAQLYWEGGATFHSQPTRFNTQIGDRPMANPLLRLQAQRGHTQLTTLRHEVLQLDETMRDFLAGLDGTRSRLDIARAYAPEYNIDVGTMLERLEVALGYLARAPFLVQ